MLPDENGGFRKTIGETQSAGEIHSTILPKGARLAKTLGTLGVASLAGAAFQKPEAAAMFYSTDDASILINPSELKCLVTCTNLVP